MFAYDKYKPIYKKYLIDTQQWTNFEFQDVLDGFFVVIFDSNILIYNKIFINTYRHHRYRHTIRVQYKNSFLRVF